jgi:pimeloyl-ACP methyl ester carboxylesterase
MKIVVDKRHADLGRQKRLEWVRVRHPRSGGLIFVPPLIGGNFAQQVKTFRRLIRQGYDLITFNYSGHGNSSDKFSPGATIRDTLYMLAHTFHISSQERLPLYGIASCYSAMPMLYAAHHFAEPFKGLILINAVANLSLQPVLRSFLQYYRQIFRAQDRRQGFMKAGMQYADLLFPNILKGRDRFGMLERRRTRMLKTVAEFFTLNPLQNVRLVKTPVLCLYARNDRILEIFDVGMKLSYEDDIRRVCPQALFHALDGDHFLSPHTARGEALKSIISFLRLSPSEACSQ